MARAPNVHARAPPPPPRRPGLTPKPARYAFFLTTSITQRDAICRVTLPPATDAATHDRLEVAVGRCGRRGRDRTAYRTAPVAADKITPRLARAMRQMRM